MARACISSVAKLRTGLRKRPAPGKDPEFFVRRIHVFIAIEPPLPALLAERVSGKSRGDDR